LFWTSDIDIDVQKIAIDGNERLQRHVWQQQRERALGQDQGSAAKLDQAVPKEKGKRMSAAAKVVGRDGAPTLPVPLLGALDKLPRFARDSLSPLDEPPKLHWVTK